MAVNSIVLTNVISVTYSFKKTSRSKMQCEVCHAAYDRVQKLKFQTLSEGWQ